ncbi:hypothetical protein GCM10022225_73370 [Plantactinospora mayteni]|uniref:Secreted protein n=1 Tax=Plantactinospora mayteni TaxID=566021 RepID=A0ABQ4F1N1_9ACTN|nr:hypothetical protein [Plantactinospora mayteni]GIH00792.1 hypothetical protein Pma05_73640 [Plantactinospora mayteni]
MSHPLGRPAARAAAVLASALALTLGTAPQSQAAGPWVPAPCATGQFTAVGAAHGGYTALYGQVTGCAPDRANSAFAVVVFKPQDWFATAYPESLVSYQPGGPTHFAGTIPTSQQVGVCAMRTLTERIACARVTWPEDGPATLEPIATTDPLVAAAVRYEDDQPEPPVGFCGSCLDDPQG